MKCKAWEKILICAVASAFLGGCAKERDRENIPAASESSAVTSEEETQALTPFTEYSLKLRGETENYMIIIRRGEHENEISVTVENNRYQSREFVITAPYGYDVYLPYSSEDASTAVKLISNDIDSTPIPDIMQFTFYISEYGTEVDSDEPEPALSVSRMFTVDEKGELREIRIVTPEDTENDIPETVHEYLDKTQLYHTEPLKFIYEIAVDGSVFDDEGNVRPPESRVKIKTMTFDYENSRLVLGTENITEENPLYFGYAYWAAANLAAQNFIMSSFNVSDFDNFVEETASDGTVEYYFKIDDSRFNDTGDLLDYLGAVFSPRIAGRIFSESPQKYADINGELYGIAGDGSYDRTLGTLTFSGMEISEDRMLFRSRQEKYDEYGSFTGYTDGGNFVISRDEEGEWRVTQYRYPYS
ncbi:MAG: hypothetical protein NC078_01355 [Ruminococcus sp.]|nr:hypothetical protein [Ruminococcus sp.]